MTQPAEVTSRADWNDLLAAIELVAEAIDGLRDYIAGQRDADADPDGDGDGRDRDAELAVENDDLDQVDLWTDDRLDGNFDPDPDEPELET